MNWNETRSGCPPCKVSGIFYIFFLFEKYYFYTVTFSASPASMSWFNIVVGKYIVCLAVHILKMLCNFIPEQTVIAFLLYFQASVYGWIWKTGRRSAKVVWWVYDEIQKYDVSRTNIWRIHTSWTRQIWGEATRHTHWIIYLIISRHFPFLPKFFSRVSDWKSRDCHLDR